MRKYLPLIQRPSHYLGSEWGARRKPAAGVRVRVALAFPDLYEVGMSYLGMKILMEAVSADPRFAAERVFAPAEDAAKVLRERGAPLASLESDTPLADFDAVAFSLTHELCYANVLYMLELAGVTWRANERREDEPFILGGGGCAFNAEPAAPFFDALALGDGEGLLPAMLDVLDQAKTQGLSRRRALLKLARLPGVYVPSFYREETPGGRLLLDCPGPADPLDPAELADLTDLAARQGVVEKALAPDLNDVPFPTLQPVPFGQTAHDRFILEIARGCTRGCRFCQAGMIYRPVRERSLDAIDAVLRRGLAETGFEDLSFLSLSTGDFSALQGLFDRTWPHCKAEQASISMPSLRVGSLSPSVIKALGELRRTGATIAPEAGSQRLRDVINKGVTEEGLLSHLQLLSENGWRSVKLYFMIGLPTETDDDLLAIADLCLKASLIGRKADRLQVSAAVSPFVPKPHTPFQWEPMIGLSEIRRRVELLRETFRPHRRLKLRWHEPEMSFLEGVFSRGDRRLAPVVESACRKGALFASWSDRFRLAPWLEALAEHDLSPESFLVARDPEAGLPWDHLHCGVSRKYLLRERRRALEIKVTPDCRYAACQSCGVCALDGRPSGLTEQARTMDIRPRLIRSTRDQAEPTDAPLQGRTTEPSHALPNPTTEASPLAGHALATPEEAPHDLAQASSLPTPPPAPAVNPRRKPIPAGPGAEMIHKAAMFRVRFKKLGQAAFLSQLELQRALERALRRARLPLSFSGGFHPTPLLSFGRALPVGVRSLDERFTLTLRQDLPTETLLNRLRPTLPTGLLVSGVERLPMIKGHATPQREDFQILWRTPALADEGLAHWRRFQAAAAFPWTRPGKKGDKTTDLRPLVLDIAPTSGRALAFTLDVFSDYVSPLKLALAVTPGLPLDGFVLLKLRQREEP